MRRRSFVGGAFAGARVTGASAAPQNVEGGGHPHHDVRQDRRQSQRHRPGRSPHGSPSGRSRRRRRTSAGCTTSASPTSTARALLGRPIRRSVRHRPAGRPEKRLSHHQDHKRTAKEARAGAGDLAPLLKTDYVDLWQVHAVQSQDDIDKILAPGGAIEAFEAAKKAGKCRFIGFTGHFDPEVLAALLKAYDKWDTVMMPIHAADHAYLSFEQTALPVAIERGVGIQAIKVFGKAFLLRSLSPTECLRYVLSQPACTLPSAAPARRQMEDNIRAVQSFRKMTPEEIADVRKRALVGSGVYVGSTLESGKGS